MSPRLAVLLGLVLTLTIGAGCEAVSPAYVDPAGNDPVPLPPDLAAMIAPNGSLAQRLGAADESQPQVSATQAVEVAGKVLLEELDGNRVPRQDPSIPDGLIRRLLADPPEPPRSVWIVAYRWKAGFNCNNPNGGPGPCKNTSFYFIDDRTGELVGSAAITE